MTDSHSGDTAFKWTTTFFKALQKRGVRHIVISPGSRSTPLTLAAASNKHFKKHVILDERSAAFTALGIAKATNIPAVLICTSGTAAANYYPAVIESRQSGVPMILATADRPPHLRATGANQAIDQLKMFGDYPVFFHEVGEPRAKNNDLNRLKVLARQAVSISLEKRGPVHLNFPFRKPLEPNSELLDDNHEVQPAATDSLTSLSSLQLAKSVQNDISDAQRPLIIVGPLAPKDDTESIARLAGQISAPVLAESSIDAQNCISGFAGFLRNKQLCSELEPDLILRFGFQPTTKALELGLNNWAPGSHYHFASTHEWQDATFSAAERIPWMGQVIHFGDFQSPQNIKWLKQWKSVEEDFGGHVEKSMQQETALTDGAVYDHISPQIPEKSFIAVSNSFPARDIHLFGQRSARIPLYQNRGVSGIDGVTSTAIGLSLSLQKPGVLFTGDLAFLHDTNALLNQNKVEHPLTIIVINNSGGSIFRMLPIKQHNKYFEPYFETPQSVDIQKLTASYNIPYLGIKSHSKLAEFQLSDWVAEHHGLSVIECKTDADASMKLRKKLWAFQ